MSDYNLEDLEQAECHAEGCRQLHMQETLMCKPHWTLLDDGIRSALWKAFFAWRGHPVPVKALQYRLARMRAIWNVAVQEGKRTEEEVAELDEMMVKETQTRISGLSPPITIKTRPKQRGMKILLPSGGDSG